MMAGHYTISNTKTTSNCPQNIVTNNEIVFISPPMIQLKWQLKVIYVCLYLMGFRINEVASDGIFLFKNGEDLYHVCDWRNKFTDALCIQHIQNPISCMVFSSTQLIF